MGLPVPPRFPLRCGGVGQRQAVRRNHIRGVSVGKLQRQQGVRSGGTRSRALQRQQGTRLDFRGGSAAPRGLALAGVVSVRRFGGADPGPSSVRGPVARPPCIRQGPFFIAGARQDRPSVRGSSPHSAGRGSGCRCEARAVTDLDRRVLLDSLAPHSQTYQSQSLSTLGAPGLPIAEPSTLTLLAGGFFALTMACKQRGCGWSAGCGRRSSTGRRVPVCL